MATLSIETVPCAGPLLTERTKPEEEMGPFDTRSLSKGYTRLARLFESPQTLSAVESSHTVIESGWAVAMPIRRETRATLEHDVDGHAAHNL